MATKAKKDQAAEPELDRKGFVTVSNGDTHAKILPESLRVWEKRGWTVASPDDVSTADADPFTDDELDTVEDTAASTPQEG